MRADVLPPKIVHRVLQRVRSTQCGYIPIPIPFISYICDSKNVIFVDAGTIVTLSICQDSVWSPIRIRAKDPPAGWGCHSGGCEKPNIQCTGLKRRRNRVWMVLVRPRLGRRTADNETMRGRRERGFDLADLDYHLIGDTT
jgi:hypothetical protein